MGGGGGGSTVANTNLHPSVVPAFGGAASATNRVQQLLPIEHFTNFNPALTAGIAPLQQQAMRAAIHSTQTPSGLSALFGMANPLNMITSSMMQAAQPNNALGEIYGRLGFQPPAMPSPMYTGQAIQNAMPALPSGELFPGMGAVNPGLVSQGVNMITSNPPVEGMRGSNIQGRRDFIESQIRGDMYS
jgi:hypothetical protein